MPAMTDGMTGQAGQHDARDTLARSKQKKIGETQARSAKRVRARKGKLVNDASMTFNPIGSASPDPQDLARFASSNPQDNNHDAIPPDDWKDKTPAFALGRLGGPHAWDYPVCIDSSSSVSLIDDAFAREYLPYIPRQHTDNEVKLMGIGDTVATEWLSLNLYFRSYLDDTFMVIRAKFLLVPGMRHFTKIILGNDVLVIKRAKIDLGNRRLTFPGIKGCIAIWCTVQSEVLAKPIARPKKLLRSSRSTYAWYHPTSRVFCLRRHIC
ncbi:hypothetical protein QFC20_007690 [Naganishia adeliensis]|uniref:Uncharacterized protein n=1 Tax=Naganishia adeliensis TaxID=92952 RepID=A0ACC2UW98_9TREE|nr:hypothetical protein QFC20_007690 [Naganishia adeliensis]